MGRRKIEIKKIQNKAYLKATFSKRRKGLFGKARELCDMCGAEIAILTVSQGGRFHNVGRPNVESVIARYCGDETSITVDENHDDCVISHEDDDEDLEGEQEREVEVSTGEVEEELIKEMNLIEHINRERDGRMRKSLLLQKFWWDEEKPVDPEQLEMYYHSLTQLRNNVVSVLNDRKMRELYATDYLIDDALKHFRR
ncbi:hypothetical protein ACLB2K_025529 [Fragaria x ananassa]